nr:phosphodiester glycosidase family protein [Butyrivibrio sp.]
MPVNSVGFLEDGTVVFFMADGRQYPRSVGMTINEQADFLVAQGVKTAIYLDGGGSATVVSRREGEKTYAIRNNPSDGSERNISSGFLLVANALSDGVFDHASVSPNGDSYTPGSLVAFSAKGVDKGGSAAELPASGLSWALAENSADKGTVDETNGLFISNGTLGEVTVELLYEGNKVGESTIKIAEPDSIYFSSASASLDFGERSALGLVVRSENADIFYKNGDFNWTIEALNAESAGKDLGHMEGNTFVAGESDGAMNALVTVSYTRMDGTVLTASIKVEIGKMPVVMFDFEPTENGPQKGAHFHWGKSNYVDAGVTPGYYGDYPELTVPVANSNSINETVYATLTAPFRFTGNYDTSVPAAEIFKANGYSFYLWPNNSITYFCAGNVTTTSEANGGQVRFGEYSMELNFDYASYDGSSNSNYYIRNCAGTYDVEGQPTELGVWVYADAETYNLAGYTLHADVAVFNGTGYSTKNFTLVHDDVDAEGNISTTSTINWVGWKYCYVNIESIASYYSPEHPYKIRNGEGMIWLSYAPASGGGRYSGTFYFDNYRFVYGTNLDDLDNPYFKSLTVNGKSIFNETEVEVDSSNVEITAAFADVDGKNASGIDTTKTTFAIDGQEIGCDGDEKSATTRLELA